MTNRFALALVIFHFFVFCSLAAFAQSGFIRSAQKISYAEAEEFLVKHGHDPKKLFYYCCRASETRRKSPRNFIQFEKESGWFLHLEINRVELLTLDMQGKCKGFFGSLRDCSPEEIRKEFTNRDSNYPYIIGWYGKYHGYFEASDNDGVIPYTDFLLGHSTTLISRTPELDLLLIGPMNREPVSMSYKMSNGNSISIF